MNEIKLFSECVKANSLYDNGSYIPVLSNIKGIHSIASGSFDILSGLYYLIKYQSLDKVASMKGSVKDLLEYGLKSIARGVLEQVPIIGNIALAIVDTSLYARQSYENIILYGLTADPPHRGHLGVVQALQKQKGYEKATFIAIPVGIYVGSKQTKAEKHHRFAMTKLMLKEISNVTVSDFEIQREVPSETIQTISYFKKKYPYAKLHFVLSTDAANVVFLWKKYEDILSIVKMIIMPRRGYNLTQKAMNIFAEKARYSPVIIKPDSTKGVTSVHGVELPEVSSTVIRADLSAGKKAPCLTDKVNEYIQKHKLYGCQAPLKQVA